MGPFASATYGTKKRTIGSWYADEAWFVLNSYPWIVRGGDLSVGSDSGVFALGNRNGSNSKSFSFRVVLSI